MASNALGARTAMVWAGWPSSQRKRLGSAYQTWPVAVNGWVRDFNARVEIPDPAVDRYRPCLVRRTQPFPLGTGPSGPNHRRARAQSVAGHLSAAETHRTLS